MKGSFFMEKKRFTYEQMDKHYSIKAAARRFGCGDTMLTKWLRLYQEHGVGPITIHPLSDAISTARVYIDVKNHISHNRITSITSYSNIRSINSGN